MGLFDRFKRQPAAPITWRVYTDATSIVANDGARDYRAPIAGARSVRIVPLTGGSHHAPTGGYQVAIACADGDAAIGNPTADWRPARKLARQLCETAHLPLDELTERLFSRVGTT